VTVNSVANVILRNNSGQDVTLQAAQNFAMGVVLGNATDNKIYVDGSGNIIISSIISGSSKPLTLAGSGAGALTLSGPNTYSGNTTISSGTLKLASTGTINSTPQIVIAAGATYDVSVITSPYTLSASTTLSASGTGTTIGSTAATIKGPTTVSLGSQGVALTFTPTGFNGDTTHPALLVSQGALTFNNNTISVNNAAATPLGVGTYRLIQVTGGTINSAPNTSVSIAGAGKAAGTTAAISVSGGNVNLVVSKGNPTFSALTASQAITYGTSSITLSGKVGTADPVYPANGETVTVTINGNAQNTTINDTTGDFSFSYNPSAVPFSASAYTITYSYGGNANLNSAGDASKTLTVNKAPLTITGLTGSDRVYDGLTTAAFTGTAAYSGLVNGETFSVSGSPSASFATATVASGKTINVTGYTAPSTNYSLTQPTLSGNITPAATTTLLAASANPVATTSNVTFVATISGSTPPTGTVLFKTNGVAWGSAVTLVADGKATNSTTLLPHGTNVVTAEYSGSSNYLPSTNTLSLLVNSAPVGGVHAVTTRTNLPVTLSVSKLKTGDSDADNDSLTLTGVANASPSGATVSLVGNVITYTPPADTFGAGSFTYTLADGFGGVTSVTVSVTITDPTAGGVSANAIYTATAGSEFVVRFAGVPGQTYTVEHAPSPTGPWAKLANFTAPASINDESFSLDTGIGVFEVREITGGSSAGYYRTVSPSY